MEKTPADSHQVEDTKRIQPRSAATKHPASIQPASSQHPASIQPASSQHQTSIKPASSQYPASIQPASSQHPTMHNKLCYPRI
jgi:hypothetical protein